ncbi:zinc dependent phospholipase C family protein [Sphingomonas sp.]|jgi:hypothetical protein|uniref:zinc dependent phospholipase C family protein n=1 Tax=Sphingomonas sp. TaxID=28214 RepID=UPI00262BF283|nr:zinc dependent phospholipase C family protein [Sphingomonas sp.]MDF2496323.1 hypothetical protein [Sphingomonas sp.]
MGKPLFRAAPIGLIAGAAVLSPAPASAFGLRTHLYIGKQVLDDVKDCKLDLPGFPTPRPIDQKICTALEKHPEAFLAGVIGPDAFPDIVIGQSYLHPGRENGRQSADWFEIILQSASSDEEISFAYGNLVHAASDIFAHSYVNNYSGGVFDILKPRDKEIEERHFLLEKYVDQRLDPALTDGLQLIVPAKFVVDTLIETNFFSDTIAMTPHEVVEALKDPSGTLGKELFERISSAKGASHAVLMQAALMVARAGRETLPCEALKAEKAMVSAHRAYLLAEAQARAMGGETIVLSFSPLPPEPSCTTASVPVDALIAELKMRLKEQVDRTGLLQDASDAIDTRNAFWSKLDRAGQTSLSQAYANYARAVRERNEKLALARFGEKWAEDVERAAEAYVEAGLETSKLMIENSKPHPPALHERASGIIHYDRWTECYLPVFFGQPFASGEATCARLEEMGEALSLPGAALKAGMGKMPRTLAYQVIDLNRRIDAFFLRFAKAAGRMVAPATADLLESIYRPERITRERLNKAFQNGANGQVRFRCVSDWIDTDLGMIDKPVGLATNAGSDCAKVKQRLPFFGPAKFVTLVHATTLSKIALLHREGVTNLAETVEPGLGSTMKLSSPVSWKPRNPRVNAGRYSVILDMPTSLDGSYQWQGKAPPYPRQAAYPAKHQPTGFGFPLDGNSTGQRLDRVIARIDGSAINGARTGFPYYQTEALRRHLFARLFPEPFEGAILDHPAMQAPAYPFRSCPGDPFRPADRPTVICKTTVDQGR